MASIVAHESGESQRFFVKTSGKIVLHGLHWRSGLTPLKGLLAGRCTAFEICRKGGVVSSTPGFSFLFLAAWRCAWGAGPMILYVVRAEKPEVTFQFRWVPQFDVMNLVKGNTLLIGMTFKM